MLSDLTFFTNIGEHDSLLRRFQSTLSGVQYCHFGQTHFGCIHVDLFTNQLYVKLQTLKQAYFDATHRDQKQKLKAQIDLLLEQLTGGQVTFDYEIFFHEVFEEQNGFDVAIGNPPSVRHELIKAFKPQFKERYPEVYRGTADLYVYFYAQGMRLLRENGTLAHITSNKFMRAGYGKKLRAYLGQKTVLHAVINFGDLPIFDATAYPTIVIARRHAPGRVAQLCRPKKVS